MLEYALQALFEVAAILGTGQQRAHVETVDIGLGQNLGDVALDDPPRQPFGNRRLANAGFANQERIVLASPAECLDDTFQLPVTTDQRVDLALQGKRVEVDRVAFEWAGSALLVTFGLALLLAARRALRHLADPVRNEIDHIEASNALLLQVVNGVRILFAEDRDQDVGTVDLLPAGRLHVQDGTLDHPLEAQRWLGVDFVLAGDGWRVFADEAHQILAQLFEVRAARAQRFSGRWVVEQGEQEMFDGDELMAFLPRLDKCHVQADFQFLRNHSVFLHYARQRVLVAPCEGCHLFNFRRRHVARKNSADATTFGMDFEHDSRRVFSIHPKKPLQNHDNEVHRCEIVVQQQDLVQRRRFELRRSCFE